MKRKDLVSGERCLAGGLQAVYWAVPRPEWHRKSVLWKGVLRRYRKQLTILLSVIIIGSVFLLGMWCFLVQLAEC